MEIWFRDGKKISQLLLSSSSIYGLGILIDPYIKDESPKNYLDVL